MDSISPFRCTWQPIVRSGVLEDGRIWHIHLSALDTAELTPHCADRLVECYIDPEHLRTLAEADGVPPRELMKECLPKAPHMLSGDFGEMLCRWTLADHGDRPRFPLFRWRFRSAQDDTVRGVDLVGFVLKNEGPSPDDVLLLCEVKTRSKKIKKDIARVAYDGVRKDHATRLANQLLFQQHHLLMQGQAEDARKLARFRHPLRSPFHVRLVAAVVHENETWSADNLDHLPEQDGRPPEEVHVLIICVDDLAKWIQEVHDEALASLEN